MVEQTERKKVAEGLAQKDGLSWESLDEVLVNAYLHNADLVIAERNPIPTDDTGKPIYTCARCEDKAYIGGSPCRECNPVGLPVEEVHPIAEGVEVGGVTRELKPGEYICDKCSNIHRENSKIGKKHLKSKAG